MLNGSRDLEWIELPSTALRTGDFETSHKDEKKLDGAVVQRLDIYIYICYPPSKIYLFCYFCFCRKHWKINGKKAAAMARRKGEQEFLQALESDNLEGKGMSEA